MLISYTLSSWENTLTLYPDRWGIITSIRFWDTELLYQDMLDDTLYDMTKSVRWGIPILFPHAGFLTDDEKKSTWWNLPQHGFARTSEWRVLENPENTSSVIPWYHSRESISQELDIRLEELRNNEHWVDSHLRGNDGKTQLTQSLSSTDIPNMFGYEWSWTIENTITLSDEWIDLIYSIANNSDKELPISWWLHPYWNIPLWDKSDIEWDFACGDIIARDIDNWSHGGTTRIDTPDDGFVRFTIPGVGTIELQLSREFHRLWIWSLPDKNFVCVEPVMWDDGAIVRDPMRIPAGGKSESVVKISLQ